MAKARPMPYLTANVQHHHADYAAGEPAPPAKTVRAPEHHNGHPAKWPPAHFLRPTANTTLTSKLTTIAGSLTIFVSGVFREYGLIVRGIRQIVDKFAGCE